MSLNFMYYNFCRANRTLTKAAKAMKTTPGMTAGIADHVKTIERIVDRVCPDYCWDQTDSLTIEAGRPCRTRSTENEFPSSRLNT